MSSKSSTAPSAMTAKDKEKSRTERVHAALRQAIIEQRLQPGARLPEDTIGESFGTSRTIAREALLRLSVEGLVELKPNRGAFVANPSLEEGRQIFVVRRGLERTVVQSLAGNLRPDQIARLRKMLEHEELTAARNEAEAIRLAGEFHVHLAEMTGNTLLIRYLVPVRPSLCPPRPGAKSQAPRIMFTFGHKSGLHLPDDPAKSRRR